MWATVIKIVSREGTRCLKTSNDATASVCVHTHFPRFDVSAQIIITTHTVSPRRVRNPRDNDL